MMTALLVIIGAALYVGIQRNIATNRKIRIADDVDAFLGIEDAPDEYKAIVFGAYEDCTKSLLAFEFLNHFLFTRNPRQRAQTIESLRQLEHRHPEYFEKMGDLLMSMLKINLKMAPIAYAISTVIVALVALVRVASRAGGNPNVIYKRAQQAYFESVHP